jgi:hypothetical protein
MVMYTKEIRIEGAPWLKVTVPYWPKIKIDHDKKGTLT